MTAACDYCDDTGIIARMHPVHSNCESACPECCGHVRIDAVPAAPGYVCADCGDWHATREAFSLAGGER